ncbi:MAG: prepilin-type N-terminal cleavage/methylation domain-containing protein [Armatimonadetes bacterium]|nr:prepilin-type N-terminal cleavage/methylation domain-containing protein [Armatimonadota bacterium]MBS1711966.1 prepilin-type N-terminal cleavage/methylation domain-containing protein [Armatimonadota bacterium]
MTTNRQNRGFTLIELLVVIAIIAILAAILFPVFAQAKEAAKKSKTLAETKQTGTAAQIYIADYDDTFMLMHPIDPATGTYLHTNVSASGLGPYRLAAVPAGWGVNAAAAQADAVAWTNSIYPYTKNNDIYSGSGSLNLYTSGFNYATAPQNLPIIGLSGNGLLNGYNATAVEGVSVIPLFWFGNGKESYKGYSYTSPYLRCTVVGTPANPAPPCRFNPSGAVQAGITPRTREDTYELTFEAANDTVRVFGRGNILVFCDSSAKYIPMGSDSPTPAGQGVRKYFEPGYTYFGPGGGYPAGNVNDPMRCVSGVGAPHYLSMFRPDTNKAYDFGTTGDNKLCNN